MPSVFLSDVSDVREMRDPQVQSQHRLFRAKRKQIPPSPIFRMTWLMSDDGWLTWWLTWLLTHVIPQSSIFYWQLTWQLTCDISSSQIFWMTWLTIDMTTSMTIDMRHSIVLSMWNDMTDDWHNNYHDNLHAKFLCLKYLCGMIRLMADMTTDMTIDIRNSIISNI